MKLHLYSSSKTCHTGYVSNVCWLNKDTVVTCGDDRKLVFWNLSSHEPVRTVSVSTDAVPTSMHVLATVSGATNSVQSEGSSQMSSQVSSQVSTQPLSNQVIALGTSVGHVALVPVHGNNGRVDKWFEAHSGAVLVVRWSDDNSTLATVGEDALIKLWSRAGMLRSTVSSTVAPTTASVFALTWSPDSSSVAYGNGGELVVKWLWLHCKSVQWTAHDALIVSLHWNAHNGLILSASEDCRVKQWHPSGRLLFVTGVNTSVVSSVRWSPDGTLFALTTFDTVKVHDRSGTSVAVHKFASEGIHCVQWSPDCTQLCFGCATGQIIFAHVIERTLQCGVWQAVNTSRRSIKVTNCTSDFSEVLDFGHSISALSFAYDHLVVVTTSQCCLYNTANWTTPHHFDVKSLHIVLVKQSPKCFLLLTTSSANFYNYDGRFVRSLKLVNYRAESIQSNCLSFNNTTLVYKDGLNSQILHFVDMDNTTNVANRNRQVSMYQHMLEVIQVHISPESNPNERTCAFLDKNYDLYIVSVNDESRSNIQTFKLSSMTTDLIWHSEFNILASLQDNQILTIWLFPTVVFFDSSLLPDVLLTVASDQLASKNSRLLDFTQNQLTMERVDKVKVYVPINPFVVMLHNLKKDGRWQEAVKMCNFLGKSENELIERNVSNAMWATLAAMTLEAKEFAIAEIAYSAINKLDKVMYMNRIRALPFADVSLAELDLMSGSLASVQQYLIQKGFILRVIVLNLELFHWKRALELAQKFNSKFIGLHLESNSDHSNKTNAQQMFDLEDEETKDRKDNHLLDLVQLVLACRKNYLKKKQKTETNKEFKVLFSEVDQLTDWTDIEYILQNDSILYTKS